jgi:hypothetical protein
MSRIRGGIPRERGKSILLRASCVGSNGISKSIAILQKRKGGVYWGILLGVPTVFKRLCNVASDWTVMGEHDRTDIDVPYDPNEPREEEVPGKVERWSVRRTA